jgi:hypothetical protein
MSQSFKLTISFIKQKKTEKFIKIELNKNGSNKKLYKLFNLAAKIIYLFI